MRMTIRHTLQRLRETKVLENYSFMTALNVVSALISFFIYPYVVYRTGKDAFGVYPYALAYVLIFQTIIDFRFGTPSAKNIVLHRDDPAGKEYILSQVFTAKSLLWTLCTIVFLTMLCWMPGIRDNRLIFIATYLQTPASVLFPTWYFQGIKQMRTVTYINLTCKLLAVPIILLCVRSAETLWVYAFVNSMALIIGGIVAMFIIRYRDGLHIRLLPIRTLGGLFHEGLPFFLTGITEQLKEGFITVLIRHAFGFGDVTLYDIARKIVAIPMMFTSTINDALFPEVMTNPAPERVRRILQGERFIGFTISLIVTIFAYPVIWILFGKEMLDAYPLAAILSWTIYAYLLVSVHLDFIFVPNGKYYLVAQNQWVALGSCILIAVVGLLLYPHIIVVALAATLSGFAEILFCRLAARKKNIF